MLVTVVPDVLQEFGEEIGRAWPIILLMGSVIGIGLKGLNLLRKTIDDTIKPIAEDIHKRLENIEAKIYPNDGSSILDKLEGITNTVTIIKEDQVVIQATLKAFYDTSDDAIYRTDVHGTVIQCNQAYLDFWGFSDMSDARTNAWMNEVEEPELVRDRLKTIINIPAEFQYSSKLKDGRVLKTVGRPVYVNDVFDGYVGYIYDGSIAHHTTLFGDHTDE